jgi:hypothetical protein
MRSYLYLIGFMLLLLGGCSHTEVHPYRADHDLNKTRSVVADLDQFPQDANAYIHLLHERTKPLEAQAQYDTKYFEPWRYKKPPFALNDILWPFKSYTYEKGFSETLLPHDEAWYLQLSKESNFSAYAQLNQYAVALRYLDVRNFPTHTPFFKNPRQAGEGFPFDYLQNSGINPNEPLYVSHLSLNGKWAYIFTSYVTGWVEVRDIAYLNTQVTSSWMNARQIEITQEQQSIYDIEGHYVFTSRIGMRLPLIARKTDHYIALAITEGKEQGARYTQVKIPFEMGTPHNLLLNRDNLTHVINQLINTHYGWGGYYELRDCSATLRDIFAPFGLWLPRNSKEQSEVGQVISLEGLSNEEKRTKIIQEAVAFETLLYKPGHILLYLGGYKGKIAVLHNVWGVKTRQGEIEGRRVIGKTIISSLDLGSELEDYDQENTLIGTLESMNIITRSTKE